MTGVDGNVPTGRLCEALPQAVRTAMANQNETEVLEAEVVDVPEGTAVPDDDLDS